MKSNFTQLPNIIIKTPSISPQAKIVYAELLSYCWEGKSAFPSHERMCSHLGFTRQTLKKYLNELKEAGLITWKQRGHTKTNCYEFLPLDGLEKELELTACENLKEFGNGESSKPGKVDPLAASTDVRQDFTSPTSDVKPATHHVVKEDLHQGQNQYQKVKGDVNANYHHDGKGNLHPDGKASLLHDVKDLLHKEYEDNNTHLKILNEEADRDIFLEKISLSAVNKSNSPPAKLELENLISQFPDECVSDQVRKHIDKQISRVESGQITQGQFDEVFSKLKRDVVASLKTDTLYSANKLSAMIGIRFGAKKANQDKSWLREQAEQRKRDAVSKIQERENTKNLDSASKSAKESQQDLNSAGKTHE